MNTVKSPDITRITLSVLFIAALIGSSIWVLKPFLPAIIWSMMVVIATWPVMTGLRQRLGGRKTPAVIIMTLLLLLVFVVPFSLALATIVANSATIADWIRAFARFRLPGSPEWMLSIPLAGPKIAAKWNELLAVPHEELAGALAPHAAKFLRWFIAEAGSVGMLFVHFLLTVLLSSFLYFNGEDAAQAVLRFARRLGGVRGENAAHLAQAAIRAVALGVVVTALVQSLASWAGLAICGVPYAILLTALVFVFGVIQIGAGPVLIPVIIYLYWKGDAGWGTLMLLWTVFVCGLDNFLRPLLIKRGANLPLLLILAGVIGGLLSFGLIGLFVGPVVLAVAYTLIDAWVRDNDVDLLDASGKDVAVSGIVEV